MKKLIIPTKLHCLALLLFFAGGAVIGPAEESPKNPMERINQAAIKLKTGDLDGTIRQYLDPLIAEFVQQYGASGQHVYCSRGPVETLLYLTKAAEKKENAISIDAAYAYAYFLKGYILIEQSNTTEALHYLDKACELSPSNPQFLSEMGNMYQVQKKWDQAMEFYERAISGARLLAQQQDTFYLRRAFRGKGSILIELKRFDEAEKMYHQCLELDPNDRIAKEELAYIKTQRSKSASPGS